MPVAGGPREGVLAYLGRRDFAQAFAVVDEVAWGEDLRFYDGEDAVVDVVGVYFTCYFVLNLGVLDRLDVLVDDGCSREAYQLLVRRGRLGIGVVVTPHQALLSL